LICGGLLAVVLAVCYLGSWDSKADAKSTSAGQRDPLVGVVFQVEVEGRWSGIFKACTGIGSRNETSESKVASKGAQPVISKAPGSLHLHDVTLTRGLTGDTKLWAWRQEVVVGKAAGAKQKCTIT
jgi:phage tail-like protein